MQVRKNLYITFLLSVLITFINCSKKNTDTVFLEFDNTVNLKSANTNIESSDLGEVVNMLICDSILIVNEMFTENIFKLFDLKTGRIVANCISKGRGPNEMLGPGIITRYKDDIFSTYPNNMQQLIYISAYDLVKGENKFRQVDKLSIPGALKTYPINDSVTISTGIFEHGRYCLHNKHSKTTVLKFDYPTDKEHKKESKIALGLAYQGLITVKPDQTRFAFAASSSGNFEIYKLLLDKDFERVVQKNYFLPKYANDNNKSVVFLKNSKEGFMSIASTGEHVYVVYSGRSREEYGTNTYNSDNILVYDWDGRPIVRFKLDRDIKNMALDEDGMKIFGYSINPVSGEPEIISYELPGY